MDPSDTNTSWKRLADFLFEVGMLRKTPRTGYQFLGSGAENVAEHSFRTAVIAYTLAKLEGADIQRTVFLALFHDLHEARTGDFNYVNKIYNTTDAEKALSDSLQGTGLDEILDFHQELETAESQEAVLAQDADQIDLILNLKEELGLGNRYAATWMECAMERLRTKIGRRMAQEIAKSDHTDWWFQGQDRYWWTRKNGKKD
ncbi:MAG: HD domain-containing protein [Desulfovibrionales bacterium]